MIDSLTGNLDTVCNIVTVHQSEMGHQRVVANNMRMVVDPYDDYAPAIDLYKIDRPDVIGYLPSRVWVDHDGQLVLMYYINSMVTAKPFGDKPAYVWSIGERRGLRISYDIRTQIFIDQIRDHDGGMLYTFVVGEDQLDMILGTDKPIDIGDQTIDDILNIAKSLDRHHGQDQSSSVNDSGAELNAP